MTTRQYIGARYIPIFADPVQWDDDRTYEYLTMVQNAGETYMSKQSVPAGAQLPDISQGEESNEFWVHMSNWNAQIEVYRQEVLQYNGRITTNETDISTIKGQLPSSSFNSTNTVKKYVDDSVKAVADVIPASSFSSASTVKDYIDNAGLNLYGKKVMIFGDSTMIESGSGSALGTYIAQYTGATVDNRAVGGTSLSDFKTLLQTLTSSDFTGVDYVFVAYGTNDWQSSREIFTRTSGFINLYTECLDLLKTYLTTQQIVLFTPAYGHRVFAGQGGDNPVNMNYAGARLKNYVDAILHVAHVNNVCVFDMFNMYGINENNYTDFMSASGTIFVHYLESFKIRIAKDVNKAVPFSGSDFQYKTMSDNQIYPASAYNIQHICNYSEFTAVKTYMVGAGFEIGNWGAFNTATQRNIDWENLNLGKKVTLALCIFNKANERIQLNVNGLRYCDITNGFHVIEIEAENPITKISPFKINATTEDLIAANVIACDGWGYTPIGANGNPSNILVYDSITCNNTYISNGAMRRIARKNSDVAIVLTGVVAQQAISAGNTLAYFDKKFGGGHGMRAQQISGLYYSNGWYNAEFCIQPDNVNNRYSIVSYSNIPNGVSIYIDTTFCDITGWL